MATRVASSAAELSLHFGPENRLTRWAMVGLNALPAEVERDIGPERSAVLRGCARDLYLHFQPGLPAFDVACIAEAAAAAGKWWPWPGAGGSDTRAPLGLDVPALWGVEHALDNILRHLAGDTRFMREFRLRKVNLAADRLCEILRALIDPIGHGRTGATLEKCGKAWEQFEDAFCRVGGGLMFMPVLTVLAPLVPPRAVGKPHLVLLPGGRAPIAAPAVAPAERPDPAA